MSSSSTLRARRLSRKKVATLSRQGLHKSTNNNKKQAPAGTQFAFVLSFEWQQENETKAREIARVAKDMFEDNGLVFQTQERENEKEKRSNETLLVGTSHQCLVDEAEDLGVYEKYRNDKGVFVFTHSAQEQLVWSMIYNVCVGENKTMKTLCGNREETFPVIVALQGLDDDVVNVAIAPLHDETIKNKLFDDCMRNVFTDPIDAIRDYYGEAVAFYFAWMQYFTWWLFLPSFAGAVAYYMRPADVSVDDDAGAAVFGFFMVVWGFVFIKFWERRQNELSCHWGTLSYRSQLDLSNDELRPEFHGEMAISPITDRPERTYPSSKRAVAYLFSVVVTVALLLVVFVIMVCSLNLQGYMSDKMSIFHVPSLHVFSDPGAIFDPNGNFVLALVPVTLHSLTIMLINGKYRDVAEWLTERENHRTKSAHENSLILKRFVFEAIDCYLPLFYLAFHVQDSNLVRKELTALFSIDSVRRVATESLVPWITKKVTVEKEKVDALTASTHLEEYDSFDDFLEMCIEFGYCMLFASAFPLACFGSVLCNLVEVRSDAFKLSFVHRKPISTRTNNIGSWETVLKATVYLSILTNSLILLTSSQLSEFFPSLYKDAVPDNAETYLEGGNVHQEADEVFKAGAGRYAVGVVMAVEHVLILIAVAIHHLFSDMPNATSIELQRQEFQRLKLEEEREVPSLVFNEKKDD